MQQGVRAVEAYRRAVLVDGVTADNETVAPVYKLEEICTILRSSTLDVVREVLERILKRLNHKSPLVKQKALRLIKFAVGKAGPEFRRELQRQAPAVRTLIHYRGQPDALKGDALNKAVRDTAQEAMSAMFASDEKISAMEEAGRRIQGFGSTNYDMPPPPEEKKTIFSGMVGFGSASMRQMGAATGNSSGGFNTKSSSYRGHDLRGSLASSDRENKYDSTNSPSSPAFDHHSQYVEQSNGRGGGSHGLGKKNSQEEHLVDVVTTPGGVRLQPSRDTMQAFLTGAEKLDGEKLGHALKAKLQDHSWQVRLKAICTVEALMRQRGSGKVFDTVGAMFAEDAGAILECACSPQASLREKSKKVLDLLGLGSEDDGEKPQGTLGRIPPPPGSTLAPHPTSLAPPIQVPDLIDTWDDLPESTDELVGISSLSHQEEVSGNESTVPSSVSAAPVDVFAWFESPGEVVSNTDVGDPFTPKSQVAASASSTPDLFSGLNVDTSETLYSHAAAKSSDLGKGDSDNLFSGLTVGNGESDTSAQQHGSMDSLADLMGGLSTEIPNSTSDPFQSLSASGMNTQQSTRVPATSLGNQSGLSHGSPLPTLGNQARPLGIPLPQGGGGVSQPMMYMNPAVLMGMAGGGLPPNMLLQQALASGALGYGGINAAFMQQQFTPGLLASMQRQGVGMGMDIGAGGGLQGGSLGHGSALGNSFSDGFDFSNNASANYMATETKKEETKAFDFLKDHVTSTLGSKTAK
jgi:hypothetical protein